MWPSSFNSGWTMSESEGRAGLIGRTAPTRTVYDVPDMDCASCVAKIRGRLESLDGVLEVEGSPIARTLSVSVDSARVSSARVQHEVHRLGYSASPRGEDAAPAPRASVWRGPVARIAYGSMALFAIGLAARVAGVGPAALPDAFFVLSALVGGWNFFPRGLAAARALALDMNFLMTVAILGAVGVGETMEAAAIAFLFAISELLESYAVDRARGSVEALMELAPDRARRVREDGSEETVALADLRPGDHVIVRPGERVPIDGAVTEGHSAVDESPLTGESMPVEKSLGTPVFSGTINREGWLRVEVERLASDSTLARIVRLVEQAEGRKTRSEYFVERFARVYTPIVTGAALLLVVLPVVLFGAPFEPWFVRGLTLLVIACPCALVISTPVAVVSGVTAAARNGVLIKGGRYLEALGDVAVVAFDKTGTLTMGAPEVVEVAAEHPDLLRRVAALESRSEHPLARAIVAYLHEQIPPGGPPVDVRDFRAVPGRGAEAVIDGVRHRIGAPEWLGVAAPESMTGEGRSVVGLQVGGEGRVGVWFALADRARTRAAESVRALRAAGVTHTVMLTGDSEAAARAIADEVGIDEVRARLLPEDKLRAVEELEARYGAIAMVGDGINDAPALAASTVGIVMGAMGSDAALETADVALMRDDLTRLPYVRRLSGRARRVIRQNIAAAIVVKAALALAVPFGLVSLVTAVVAGDLGVSLAVTLNALRLAAVRDD